MLLLIASLQLFHSTTVALPLQNTTTTAIPQKVGWTSTPQVRGTFDLLLSCLATLFLCAWTAYHPNVQVGRSDWRKMAHRCTWMLVAVFAPEAVLWCAWEQLWTAKRLMARINGEDGEKESSEEEKRCSICEAGACDLDTGGEEKITKGRMPGHAMEAHTDAIEPQSQDILPEPSSASPTKAPNPPWTKETAFFALSGGLALPHPNLTQPPLPLTPTGILLLHRLHLLPALSVPVIADKSKADAITKALVCVQAAWFLLQGLARAVKRLPVTSLEIHVLAHVVCAFAIYAVWWGKGYDVGLPVALEGEEARDLGALFSLGEEDEEHLIEEETTTMHCSSSSPPLTLADIATSQQKPPLRRSSTRKYWNVVLEYFDMPPRQPRRHLSSSSLSQTALRDTPELSAHLERANRAFQFLRQSDVHVTYTFNYKVLEGEGDGDGIGDDAMAEHGTIAEETRRIRFGAQYTVPTRSDLKIEGLDRITKRTRSSKFIERQIKTYVLLTAAYGSIHLLAFSPTHFPTQIEHRLWLASTGSMVAGPLGFMALYFASSLFHKLLPSSASPPESELASPPPSTPTPRSPTTPTSPSSSSPIVAKGSSIFRSIWTIVLKAILDIFWWLCCVVAFSGLVCYPFARLYLVLESFAGLRSVDRDVYKTVEWAGFIPHAG